jgi:hypothetical protein
MTIMISGQLDGYRILWLRWSTDPGTSEINQSTTTENGANIRRHREQPSREPPAEAGQPRGVQAELRSSTEARPRIEVDCKKWKLLPQGDQETVLNNMSWIDFLREIPSSDDGHVCSESLDMEQGVAQGLDIEDGLHT